MVGEYIQRINWIFKGHNSGTKEINSNIEFEENTEGENKSSFQYLSDHCIEKHSCMSVCLWSIGI
jgi:hypothetical protein